MTHPDPILAAVERGALVAHNHSGGKDSDMSLIAMMGVVPPEQLLVIHATLGESEWPGALELARSRAADIGAAFVTVSAGYTFLEMVERRHRARADCAPWPSPQYRACTSNLKRGPLEKGIRAYASERHFTEVISVMGLRAEESDNRAGASACVPVPRLSFAPRTFKHAPPRPGRTWTNDLPIHALKEAEVFSGIKAAGWTPHHAYALGNQRVSCVFCIMSSKCDLRVGAVNNPDFYRKYVALEQRTGYTLHPSRKTLPELTGIDIAGRERPVPDRPRRGNTQPALF